MEGIRKSIFFICGSVFFIQSLGWVPGNVLPVPSLPLSPSPDPELAAGRLEYRLSPRNPGRARLTGLIGVPTDPKTA